MRMDFNRKLVAFDIILWLKENYVTEAKGSSGKRAVYNHYVQCCKEKAVPAHIIISQTYFGKLVKRAFPNIRYNRKGPRGKALDHYTGLKRIQVVTVDKMGCLDLLTSAMKASFETPSHCKHNLTNGRDHIFPISKDGSVSITIRPFDRKQRTMDSSPERSPESVEAMTTSPIPPPHSYTRYSQEYCPLVSCRSCHSPLIGSPCDNDDIGSFNSLALYQSPPSGALLQQQHQYTPHGLPHMFPSGLPTVIPEYPRHSLSDWSNVYDEVQQYDSYCQDCDLYGQEKTLGPNLSPTIATIGGPPCVIKLQEQQPDNWNPAASYVSGAFQPAISLAWC